MKIKIRKLHRPGTARERFTIEGNDDTRLQ
jgi:hypothetical protein